MRVAVPLALLATLSIVSLAPAGTEVLDPDPGPGPQDAHLDFAIVTPVSLAHEFELLAGTWTD